MAPVLGREIDLPVSARAAASGATGARKWSGLISSSERASPAASRSSSASPAVAGGNRFECGGAAAPCLPGAHQPAGKPGFADAGVGARDEEMQGNEIASRKGEKAIFGRMLHRLYGPILAAKADRLGTYAAALAYCFVLSLIPFLVVTFTLANDSDP